jgi:hypothetical protein
LRGRMEDSLGLDMEPLAPQPRGTCDHHAPYPIRSAIRVNDMMVRVLCENGGDLNIKLGLIRLGLGLIRPI